MLLLCSCVTQRQAEKYFDEHTAELADYVDKHTAYTREHGSAYAAKHFPARFYPPAVYTPAPFTPGRLHPALALERRESLLPFRAPAKCPDCVGEQITKTVYLKDTAALDALRVELYQERQARGEIRRQLKRTEAERDYWQEMNRKKFWALIAMLAFALLYILFKILAARVRGS